MFRWLLEDLSLCGELCHLRPQLRALRLQPCHALLERLIGIRPAERRRGPQRAVGHRTVGRGLLFGYVGLQQLPQRQSAPDDLEIIRDTAERRPRCSLV